MVIADDFELLCKGRGDLNILMEDSSSKEVTTKVIGIQVV